MLCLSQQKFLSQSSFQMMPKLLSISQYLDHYISKSMCTLLIMWYPLSIYIPRFLYNCRTLTFPLVVPHSTAKELTGKKFQTCQNLINEQALSHILFSLSRLATCYNKKLSLPFVKTYKICRFCYLECNIKTIYRLYELLKIKDVHLQTVVEPIEYIGSHKLYFFQRYILSEIFHFNRQLLLQVQQVAK